MVLTSLSVPNSAADPGFSQGGANTPVGAPTYDFAKFSRKLHEIKRIWVPGKGGGAHELEDAGDVCFQPIFLIFQFHAVFRIKITKIIGLRALLWGWRPVSEILGPPM